MISVRNSLTSQLGSKVTRRPDGRYRRFDIGPNDQQIRLPQKRINLGEGMNMIRISWGKLNRKLGGTMFPMKVTRPG